MRKKLYMMISLLLITFGLFACETTPTLPTDQDIVDAVIVQLEIGFATGDDSSQVTQNITLDAAINDVTITWESSHPQIISTFGIVVRPVEDTTVTLTATLTYQSYSTDKIFLVVVKAEEIVIDPLELALDQTNQALSYQMNILFNSDEDSYTVIVKMDENGARVDALGAVIYYEVVGDVCYIYELIGIEWQKSEVTCSEKGTAELSFINNFSKDYFVEQTDGSSTYYILLTDYYNSLQSFLGGVITSNFRMTLQDDYIHTISFTMVDDSITFDIVITLSGYNSTTVTLPTITS